MTRRTALSTAAAFALGAVVVACQIVAGIERVEKVDPAPEPVDAGVDVLEAGVVDPCSHVRPPARPLTDDAVNEQLEPFYLALHTLTLVPPPPAPVPGFDLDLACTCDTRPGTAYDGGASCVSGAKPYCDFDGGVDNQVVSFLKDYSAFIDLDTAVNVNGRIATGKQNAIVVVSRYNGRANDSEVAFGLFTSEGMKEGATCPGSTTDSENFTSPGWCGEDKWTASRSTVEGDTGKFFPKAIGTGYVGNYRFVVELNNPAIVPFGTYRLTIGSPIWTGRLVPLDDKLVPIDTSAGPGLDRIKYWRLEDAVLAGRIPAAELLAAVGTVDTPGDADGGPLCTSALFPTVKSSICDHIDINATKALDFIPDARCDALSVAISLTADSVRVVTVVAATPATNECYPTDDGGAPTAGPPGVDYRCP
ncbi:MAG: hypothetical protein JWP87_4408 [Labilithrix sp.]|nr:hypothetical protein [Labilithrix sp.]